MILLVLLHKGRGGGLSDMFGGGVSSSLGGSSVAERNLDRLTVGIGVIWFACVIALGLLLRLPELRRGPVVAGGGNAIRGSRVGAGPMGEAERGEAAPRQAVTYFCSHEHRSVVTFSVEATVPGLVGLPQVRAARRPGRRERPAGAEDRAVQDPPRLREGAPLRHRGRRHPRRGDPAAALAPQVRRHHLLTRHSGHSQSADRALGGTLERRPGTWRHSHGRRPGTWGHSAYVAPVDDAAAAPAYSAVHHRRHDTNDAGWLPPDLALLDERCPLPLDAPFTTQQAVDAGRVPVVSCACCSTGR